MKRLCRIVAGLLWLAVMAEGASITLKDGRVLRAAVILDVDDKLAIIKHDEGVGVGARVIQGVPVELVPGVEIVRWRIRKESLEALAEEAAQRSEARVEWRFVCGESKEAGNGWLVVEAVEVPAPALPTARRGGLTSLSDVEKARRAAEWRRWMAELPPRVVGRVAVAGATPAELRAGVRVVKAGEVSVGGERLALYQARR